MANATWVDRPDKPGEWWVAEWIAEERKWRIDDETATVIDEGGGSLVFMGRMSTSSIRRRNGVRYCECIKPEPPE